MGSTGSEGINSMQVHNGKLPWRHVLGFSVGLFGVNMSFAMVSSYLPYFYTDVFFLSPAIMAVLFASCRIWDGVTDPVMGMLADGTNSRWGKFRPYLLMTPIPMIVLFALTFYVPDLSATWKIVWAFVTYFGLQMCKTAVAVPYYALPAVMTPSPQERTKISGMQQIFSAIAFLLIGVATLPIVHSFDTEKQGFLVVTLIFGGLAAVTLWIAFFSTRKYDRKVSKVPAVEGENFNPTFKEKIGFLIQNKPLMKLMVPTVLYFIITSIIMAMGIYFFKYNIQMFESYPAFMAFFILAMITGSAVAPAFVKKFGKLKVFHIGNIMAALTLLLVFYIAQGSSPEALAESWSIGGVSFILIISSTFFSAFLQVLFPAMVLDCVEYSELKSGLRMEGLLNSAFLIANKGGMALGGFVVGVGLSMLDYKPNQEVYSDTFLFGIAAMFLLLPAVIRLFMSTFMMSYDLNEEKHRKIVEKLNLKRAEAEGV